MDHRSFKSEIMRTSALVEAAIPPTPAVSNAMVDIIADLERQGMFDQKAMLAALCNASTYGRSASLAHYARGYMDIEIIDEAHLIATSEWLKILDHTRPHLRPAPLGPSIDPFRIK